MGSIPTPRKQIGSSDTKIHSAINSVVEYQVSNLLTWVRFPNGASEFVGTSQKPTQFQYCLTVRISGFHPGSPGSTPGIGKELLGLSKRPSWPHSITVSTWDFESRSPSSILGGAFNEDVRVVSGVL